MQKPVRPRSSHHGAGCTRMACTSGITEAADTMAVNSRIWPTRRISRGVSRQPPTNPM